MIQTNYLLRVYCHLMFYCMWGKSCDFWGCFFCIIKHYPCLETICTHAPPTVRRPWVGCGLRRGDNLYSKLTAGNFQYQILLIDPPPPPPPPWIILMFHNWTSHWKSSRFVYIWGGISVQTILNSTIRNIYWKLLWLFSATIWMYSLGGLHNSPVRG